MDWLVPVLAVTSIAALLAWRYFNGRRQPGYLSITEYWIYTDAVAIPPQQKIMDRMINANPHNPPDQPLITTREGMLFTDIRLHMGLAKRERNPHIFRPDLFEENAVPSPEVLAALPDCHSMIKVRYTSEAVLDDNRHLQFMPHLADAVADLTQAKVVFDHIAERLWTAQDFHNLLAQNPNAERPEAHVRVLWKEESEGCHARTLGLRKLGLKELQTDPQEPDSEVVVTGLMIRLAYKLFRTPYETGPFEFTEFGDTFKFTLGEDIDAETRLVHLTRRQTK